MELSTNAVAVTTLDVVPDSKGADKSGRFTRRRV